MQIVVELVKRVFQLRNLRRVPGPPGQISEVDIFKYGVEHDEYINNIGLPGYWPSSMLVAVSDLCLRHLCCTKTDRALPVLV